ncbi:hypothetical protein [Methylosinus sp. RM1]|uniref:hypothetical protein n=1 Tax=Methylosinus sp. RM1 TaxID=2583817 RepID=UPI00140D30EC|nr:hypothetical protein [Methylosinus sp. RM1]
MNRELIKLQLMAQGMPEWRAEMIAAEKACGASAARADARAFANIHGGRNGPEPSAQERAEWDRRAQAQAEQEARWEAAREESRRREAEWRRQRDTMGV